MDITDTANITTNRFHNLKFDLFIIENDKYNNLEVNEFFTNLRSMNIPKTEFVYLNDIPLPLLMLYRFLISI